MPSIYSTLELGTNQSFIVKFIEIEVCARAGVCVEHVAEGGWWIERERERKRELTKISNTFR